MSPEVIVVGGGPAGASAAMLLAREGYSVELFDRAFFPRDKPCGEFLNPAACDLLSEIFGLDAEELLSLGAAPVSLVQLQLAIGDRLDIPMMDGTGKAREGLTIRRTVLDALLIDRCRRAGVTISLGHSVRSVVRSKESVVVQGWENRQAQFQRSARLVLAADGTHSALARQEGLTRPTRRLAAIGIVAHFSGMPTSGTRGPGTWMFPSSGDGVLFGFTRQAGDRSVLSAAVPKRFSKQIASDAKAYIRSLVGRYPALAIETAGAEIEEVKTVPCFGHHLARTYAERMLFLGDAARFVDPFTGEGIHHALQSGLLAAQCSAAALASDRLDSKALSGYDKARSDLNRRYFLCGAIREVCVRPGLFKAAANRLHANGRLAESLVSALADLESARTIACPSFVARLVLQSARAST